jgi:hypothetical protein
MAQQSPREKMAERERKLDALNTFGLTMRKQSGPTLMQRLKGEDDYGTSLGGGATAAMKTASQKAWDEGKSLREMEPDVRKAMREAAAEERREAKEPRKYAKGGSVRGGGCEQRGKTKGRFV